jgi:membrane-bound lytic murein transglycosylase B
VTSNRLLTFFLLFAIVLFASTAEAKKRHNRKSIYKTAVSNSAQNDPTYADRADVMLAADDIALRRSLDPLWVQKTLAQAHYISQAVKFMQPAPVGTVKNWYAYRSRFIEPMRIRAGVRFWQDNQQALNQAEQETGVPAQIIVGIIGVETIYGRNMGSFRVLDALTTLAFDFPTSHPRAKERSEFFKSELEQFLSLMYRTSADPLEPRGSYAGAMGMPQFMPSSWVKYAIDFDGDGKVDLFNSPTDVIGSVANYFKTFGWQSGMPTHYPVSFDASKLDLDALLAPDILPTFNVNSFIAKGAVLEGAALLHQGPLALVEVHNGNAPPSYVAGTENFYVITRYNWSSYYALAVIELGQEVAAIVNQ